MRIILVMRRWVLTALALAACTSPPDGGRRPAPAQAETTPPPNRFEEWRESPSSVYVVNVEGAVIARSVDGSVSEELARNVSSAQLDVRLGMLWIRKPGQLSAVDLVSAGEPKLVIGGIPERRHLPPVGARVVLPGDEWPFPSGTPLPRSDSPIRNSRVEIVFAPGDDPLLSAQLVKGEDWLPTYADALRVIEVESGELSEQHLAPAMSNLELAADGARVVVDASWIESLLERPRKPRVQLDSPASHAEKVLLPQSVVSLTKRQDPNAPDWEMGPCDHAPEMCGRAAPFGPYQLVVVGDTCGAFCYWSCLLHDPATGKWAVPPETATWVEASELTGVGRCDNYWLDHDGTHFLAEVGELAPEPYLCEMGQKCEPLDGQPLGWVRPGPAFLVERVGTP